MKAPLVAVTGLGAITAAGPGLPALEAALRAGRPLFGPVRGFSAGGHLVDLAAEVPLDDGALVGQLRSRPATGPLPECSRGDLLALMAASEALDRAEQDLSPAARQARRQSTLVVVGGSVGGIEHTERWLAGLGEKATAPASWPAPPADVEALHPVSTTAHQLARVLGLGGGTITVNTACSSSANALLLAATCLRQGLCRRVLAGGVDALCQLTYAGFGSLGLLDPAGCRPFDVARRGLTLGEGAAFAVLELGGDGPPPIGLLLGGASGAEAHHPTAPEPQGQRASQVIARALDDAGITAAELDYINAHGTGTPLNDLAESRALHGGLGERARSIPVSSTKSIHGHTLAAAGAIEAAVCWLGLEHGFVPPTAGVTDVDPACGLEVATSARPARLRAALSTSFGFGGNLTALVLAGGTAAAAPGGR